MRKFLLSILFAIFLPVFGAVASNVPEIYINANGGVWSYFFALQTPVITYDVYQWDVPDDRRIDKETLIGTNIIELFNNLPNIYGNGNNLDGILAGAILTRPGYNPIGVSASPTDPTAQTCIYPECNTVYVMWEPTSVIYPGIYLDYNGGHFVPNQALVDGAGAHITQRAIMGPENLSYLSKNVGNDLWTTSITVDYGATLAPISEWDFSDLFLFDFGTMERPGYTAIGISADPNTPGVTTCIYPECNTVYIMWAEKLSINIDWNGGVATNLMGDDDIVSGLWSFSDALGVPQETLQQMSGYDITELFIGTDSMGDNIITACQDPESGVDCVNPGHTLVGFSTSPYGMVENPTCVFPECNTFYAIWEPREPGTYLPGIYIDFNGGILNFNGVLMTYFPAYADNDPELNSLDGAELWTTLEIEVFQEEALYISQNPTDEISLTRDGYTFVGISADPNTPGVTTCIYPACNTFYAIWKPLVEQCPIMKNIALGNGTKIPLIKRDADSELSHPAIVVRRGNQMCYANMAPNAKSGTLNIKYKDKVYHAE